MESTGTTSSSESLGKNLSIRVATPYDLDLLGTMGYRFAELYGNDLMDFRASIFKSKMQTFMDQGIGTVLCLHEKAALLGALAGLMYDNVFDGKPCATELFWYVWPGAPRGSGTMLLRAFEEWAYAKGCTRITMALMMHNEQERLDKFYRDRDYVAFEKHYVKRI